MRKSSILVLLLLSCNGDTTIKQVNDDPEITILSPKNGASFDEGSEVEFHAIVNDDGPNDTVTVRWESDADGVLSSALADADGNSIFTLDTLTVGIHTITATAIDRDNAPAFDDATIEIVDVKDAPSIVWNHPMAGEHGQDGVEFEFSVVVNDKQDELPLLAVSLSSDMDGVFCTPPPDQVGLAICSASLSLGKHVLTATVTDTDGNSVEAQTFFEVGANDTDNDQDGVSVADGDCDDGDASVFPGAEEVVNGADDDCDGVIDEGTSVWDDDGDCYCELGNCLGSDEPSCTELFSGDCDDGEIQVNPAATEVCNGRDEDCDGSTDEGTSCVDDDLDGYTELAGDCNDGDGTVRPGAPEIADGVDQDCDGLVDEGTSAFDDDGDCYCEIGSCSGSTNANCGTVSAGDCNDNDSAISPSAAEKCDTLDNDCDGSMDESGAVDAKNWYADLDGDSYGDTTAVVASCSQPSGYAALADDCDDTNAAVNPGASELCDTVDNDCDGQVDESDAIDAGIWYDDVDGDGYGGNLPVHACSQPSGYLADSDDCDDSDPTAYPGADEFCNGTDDNCDGTVDEDTALDAKTWYEDGDGDNYGNATVFTYACSQPSGYVSRSTDCNDVDPKISPAASEICDGIDQDCNGSIDEGVLLSFYQDADGDTFGNPSASTSACNSPSGYVSNSQDCNDSDAAINPNTLWYRDADGDGYGGSSTTASCSQPSGYVATFTDCNDGQASDYPGAPELCDSRDNNCDGAVDENTATDAVTWYKDADSDTYGDASLTTKACNQPVGYVARASDCNDANGSINPSVAEICDGIDQDCDGSVDDGVLLTWYQDKDGDTYGNPSVTSSACTAPSGYVSNGADCDDTNKNVSPATLWYVDADGDGYGGTTTVASCTQPAGYVGTSTDCNDAQKSDFPGATETCDSRDNDCDGSVDEINASGCTKYYYDGDADGYGDSTKSQCLCAPSGYYTTTDKTDCYDSNSKAYPTASTYYTTNRGDGSFDYNCNGVETKYWGTSAGSCDFYTDLCATNGLNFSPGWTSSTIPACGKSASYTTACTADLLNLSCTKTTATYTQKCR